MFIEIQYVDSERLKMIAIADIRGVTETPDPTVTRLLLDQPDGSACIDIRESYDSFKRRLADYVRARYPWDTKNALKPMNLNQEKT